MSYLTLNGDLLERARIVLPFYGAWTADVEHVGDSSLSVGDSVSLVFGSQTFVGTVFRSQSNEAPGYDTRIVGGGGNLSTLLSPAQFKAPTARNVLDIALQSAQETLSSLSDTSTLGATFLRFWERPQRTLGQELDAIARACGLTWRVLSDGLIWIGTDTWQNASVDEYQVLSLNADMGQVFIAADDPTILPGQTIEGIRAGQVIHCITPDSTRTEIYADSGLDRAMGMLDALIRRSAPRDLFAFYEYRVISQSGALFELKSVDSRMPDLSNVTYRAATPGHTYTVPANSRCLVGFAAGDEQQPYIASWISGESTTAAFPVSSILNLGADPASAFVALANLTDARISAIQTKLDSFILIFNAHTHGGGAPPLPVATVLGPQASVAATKVKAT